VTDLHLKTVRQLENIALEWDTLELHIKLESPVSVLHHDDAKLRHGMDLPVRDRIHTIADGLRHPSSRG
jgi:hypothetical protein